MQDSKHASHPSVHLHKAGIEAKLTNTDNDYDGPTSHCETQFKESLLAAEGTSREFNKCHPAALAQLSLYPRQQYLSKQR